MMILKNNQITVAFVPNYTEAFTDAQARQMTFDELRRYSYHSMICAFELVRRIQSGDLILEKESEENLLDYGFDEYNRGYSTALKHHGIGELS